MNKDFSNNVDIKTKKKIAIQFILIFGVISAFGDITYEGARSVYGQYLGFLGASAAAVGVISGLGEFLGYLFRIVSGYFIDKTQRYWTVTILGYGMLISVPLLAIAGKWQIAVLFIMLERIGKAIRSPAKDTMLSYATKQLGTGYGFGLHESLDQIGAIIGPLIFTFAISITGEYRQGFTVMWIPAILTVVIVLIARTKVPNPSLLEEAIEVNNLKQKQPLSKVFWIYSIFIFISVLGFANFPIIAYHLKVQKVINEAQIPTLYAVAMLVDAIIAPIVGKVYDKSGFIVLFTIPLLTLPISILGFSSSYILAVIALVLWGAVMGIHETIMRAAIADLIPIINRGTAYGIFNTLYGLAMLLGSITMGFLYEYSRNYIITFTIITEITAFIIFILLNRKKNDM